MASVLLFHHAHGQTPGFLAFGDDLRAAGHTVHTPDLYDGNVFDTLEEGIAYATQIGFGNLLERGVATAHDLPAGLVYAGFSLGVMPAQRLAQTREGAVGALFFHACLPVSEFGETWPAGVPVQIHGMEHDPFFAGDGDIDAARQIAGSNTGAQLFVYPGDQHLFSDPSLPSYDKPAADLLMRRTIEFLAEIRDHEQDR